MTTAVEGLARARRTGRAPWAAGVIAALAAVALASVTLGAANVDALALVRGESLDPATQAILLDLRVPRLLLGLLVGAGLAVAGAVMQGLFRNPLADPSLVGVSSGAALAAALAILAAGRVEGLPEALKVGLLPLGAFAGGLTAVIVVYRLGTRGGRTVVVTLLLAGLAVEALSRAGTGFVNFVADDRELRDLTFWLLGSLGGASWDRLAWVAPVFVAGLFGAQRLAAPLDALLLGEAEAGHVGVDVERVKRWAIVLTAALVGASVALAGVIAFVGLVVPHIVRLVVGPAHRGVLVGSALVGALLVTSADLVARTAMAPAEIPIGIVTAALGAPFFVHLLRSRSAGEPC